MSTPGPLSSEQQAAIAQGQKQGQAVALWTVGMFCVFGWEYFVCLPKEIKHIWKKNITLTSVLYIANRYYGLIQFSVDIGWVMWLQSTDTNVVACEKIFRWQPVGALISIFLSQAIMASRVYALYEQSKIIIGVLGTIMAAEFAIHSYTLTLVYPAPSPPGVIIPCVAIGPLKLLVAFWVLPLIFDTITFFLTLHRTIVYWRNEIQPWTFKLLFRDGLVYFAAIFSYVNPALTGIGLYPPIHQSSGYTDAEHHHVMQTGTQLTPAASYTQYDRSYPWSKGGTKTVVMEQPMSRKIGKWGKFSASEPTYRRRLAPGEHGDGNKL